LRTLSRLEQLVADTISVLAWRVKYAPVAPEDLDRVVEFSLRAWRPVFDSFRAVLSDAVYTRVYPDWLHTQAAAVMSVCLDQDMDVFVAEDAGKVVGYVAVTFDQDPPRGEIYMIAVDPDFQRRGDATSSFQ